MKDGKTKNIFTIMKLHICIPMQEDTVKWTPVYLVLLQHNTFQILLVCVISKEILDACILF